jgi:CRP-like cAMP-binding protein
MSPRAERLSWKSESMAGREEIIATLAQFSLFGDLSGPQLEAVVGQLDEAWFGAGTRILRQGLTGSGLFFILDGSCAVAVDGIERAQLGRGDFFGEVSVLLGSPPTADVTAVSQARCLVLSAPAAEAFLNAYPRLMFRMLQVQARRLRAANTWRN